MKCMQFYMQGNFYVELAEWYAYIEQTCSCNWHLGKTRDHDAIICIAVHSSKL